jgi:hypothetical protein
MVALGETEEAKATSRAILTLSRAARAFLYYDAENDAIRAFLEAVAHHMKQALRYGEMTLSIRPYEILRDGEVIYREEDRERSLSFRLYRDGARRLTFKPSLSWDELIRLLGIISIRYIGVRQQEDDVVTLLWRAGFQNIEVFSVEGFRPEDDEEMEEEDDDDGRLGAIALKLPQGFDDRVPEYRGVGEIEYRTVEPVYLEALQGEDTLDEVPLQCLRLVEALLEAVRDPEFTSGLDPFLTSLRELQTYLFGAQRYDLMVDVVKAVTESDLPKWGKVRVEDLVPVFAEESTLGQIVASALSTPEIPPDLVELLGILPGEPVPRVLKMLRNRWFDNGRHLGVGLVERTPTERLGPVVDFLKSRPGAMAAELLRVVARRSPELASEAAVYLCSSDRKEARLAAMEVLEVVPYRSSIGRVLARALDDPEEEIRSRAAWLFAEHRQERAFDLILKREQAAAELGSTEAVAFGEALATLDADRALRLFTKWCRSGGILGGYRGARTERARAAVSGLATMATPESEKLIRRVLKRADGELRQHCVQAMVQLRRRQRGAD